MAEQPRPAGDEAVSKVLVIELPDETNLTETIKAMNAVQVANIERCRVFAAVREDAEAVLAVFDANKAAPDPQDTP